MTELLLRKTFTRKLRMLDCFCGMGGVSDGFALEGFDVTGIDIVDAPKMLGYKHRFIQADMQTLKGKDFRGYDVIWGSPPCRDFTMIGCAVGKTWKRKPDPDYGLQIVNAFTNFVEDAEPIFWIMENVDRMKRFYQEKPKIEACPIKGGKKHVFYGNFPLFLVPQEPFTFWNPIARKHKTPEHGHSNLSSWANAKIPLACSHAFARACRQQLEEQSLGASFHA